MEILEPHVKGLKFLFYIKKEGIEKISLLKIFFFIVYVVAIISAFLSFLDVSNKDLLLCDLSQETDNQFCVLSLGLFGEFFQILTLVLILGSFFLIIKDYNYEGTRKGISIIQLIIVVGLISNLVFNYLPNDWRSINVNLFFQMFHMMGFGLNFV